MGRLTLNMLLSFAQFEREVILKAILRDRHPIELSAKRLANETRLPVAWDAQRALLGIS
jgi:DNA invertase Pin-like site-specific DNA recombinase